MGHSEEFWQNVVSWRREWQTTPVFLPWEPHEQDEKAKHNITEKLMKMHVFNTAYLKQKASQFAGNQFVLKVNILDINSQNNKTPHDQLNND